MADIRWPGIRSLVLANKETSIRISQPGLPAARWRRRANGRLPFQPRIADEPEHMPSAQRAGIPSPVWGRRVHERSVIKQPRFGALNALRQAGPFEREASMPVIQAKVCARPVGCANSPGVCNSDAFGVSETDSNRSRKCRHYTDIAVVQNDHVARLAEQIHAFIDVRVCMRSGVFSAAREESRKRDLLRHMSTMNRSVIWA